MSIRKRDGSPFWHIDIRKPGGGRIRESTGTTSKKEAEEYHARVKTEVWRVAKMGEKPTHTFEEAGLRYLREQTDKADYDDRVAHLRHFQQFFAGRELASITRSEILAALPTESVRKARKKPLAPATRNRYLATIRAMLNDAAGDWEWIERAPKLPDGRESAGRIRWITREEARSLVSELDLFMRAVTAFGFATGLRQRNILMLEWSQVDMARRCAWVHPDQAKARKPIGVPLNADAMAVLRAQLGRHPIRVFVDRGEPVDKWNDYKWRAACKRAGFIEKFRFHDVRHTWASWHVQAGTPLNRLMELGGWSSYEMVLRYAHLASDHLAGHADAVLMDAAATPRLTAVR